MAIDSVKGSILLGGVVSVRRHRDAGRISEEQLSAALSAEALELLDKKIVISAWYPVSAFCELLDLDWNVAGKRDPFYMEEQGARSADNLFKGKLYQQLEYAERAGKSDTRERLVRQSRLISTMTGNLYNFLTIEVVLNEDSLDFVYRNAASFGEPLRYTTAGFMNRINERQGSKRRWSSERISKDEVRFRMSLPERFRGDR